MMHVLQRKPVKVDDAVSKVMQFERLGTVEFVSIDECEGRFLGEDLVATHDLPRFDRSGYDGFALRSADTRLASSSSPIAFEIIDHIGAGSISDKEVGEYEAVRIMTGAKLPHGCDSIVMLELVQEIERDGRKFAIMKRPVQLGDHISKQGEEAKRGDVFVKKGTRINAGIVACLATFGYAKVPVATKPRIGILATGSELLDVDEALTDGKIHNSNAHMIAAQIKRAGGKAVIIGKLADDLEASYETIHTAMNEVDYLITTGGVSVGDYDLMPDVYERLGANVLFDKIAMRPGSVTTVAEKEGCLLFGLSGNPSACYVGFELFVRPIIRRCLFSTKPHLRRETAILDVDFPKINPFARFIRSAYFFKEGRLHVVPCGMDKSNVTTSLVQANALMILPSSTRGYQKGNEVEILLLDDQEGSVWL